MIDNISLAITHGLMFVAAVLLLRRPDLDHEDSPGDPPKKPRRNRWGRDGA
ncbi:hypothetical protein ACFQ1E_08680 [Sphingomonas canadensis]|uniref:Uncharacterized protein n=1 Tax=Sphingomonas canadensis TaxID=1219257 RepID=A0ABW3H585_9SPHN|nr:hypothetical protein [Sphingomonas canadensis]MCW3836114.1 hypothetical protein [Sphingomonas canadensis]